VIELDDIDPELLSEPFEGDFPAGTWLRFDSVFDEVKRARMSESDYLPQGIWQRETKRANWSQSLELSFGVLCTRSKDLQFAAWLTEALSHLHGVRGTIKGVELIDRLTSKLWSTFTQISMTMRILPRACWFWSGLIERYPKPWIW